MTGLVKRARAAAWALDDPLCNELADEIERLRMENEKLLLANHDCEKLVIEDMRKWASKRTVDCDQDTYDIMAFEGLLDTYVKDRGIE